MKILETAIESLQQDQRIIIEEIYIKGGVRRDICRKLFISENTLHRRRKKAIAKIADILSIIF